MLQIRASAALDQIESAIRAAAHRRHASVTVVSHLGQPPQAGAAGAAREALVFTLYHSKCYAALLAADIRFAGYLPCRVAAWEEPEGAVLQAALPSDYCRMIGAAGLEADAAPLDGMLRSILEDAAKAPSVPARARTEAEPSRWRATEDQVNMRAALPQRIDYRGTKVEDEAGTGAHDSPGG